VAREKRFRTSFMGGFKKADVNQYIEQILKEFDEKLKSKDEEIAALKNENKDLRYRYEELQRRADEINETRAKIADVLIQAQEKAEKMVEEARIEAVEEKKKLEETIESEKEKLVDIRADIKKLKVEIVKILSRYEEQLSVLAKEEMEAEAAEAEAALEEAGDEPEQETDETEPAQEAEAYGFEIAQDVARDEAFQQAAAASEEDPGAADEAGY
jgi:chromosome segregation ATPase